VKNKKPYFNILTCDGKVVIGMTLAKWNAGKIKQANDGKIRLLFRVHLKSKQ
jgi:hypothetical protein